MELLRQARYQYFPRPGNPKPLLGLKAGWRLASACQVGEAGGSFDISGDPDAILREGETLSSLKASHSTVTTLG